MPGRKKSSIIAFVFLGCLLALVVVVNQMSGIVAKLPSGDKPPTPPPPPSTTAADAHWKDILAISPAGPRGSASASFSLVEFGDFQCPQCGKVRPEIEQVVSGSNGRLNMYFVQRPFPTIHRYAEAASEAAVFAAKQGKFWPMYDLLYSHQSDLEPGNYDTYAEQLGMNGDAMRKAIEGGDYRKDVNRSSMISDKIGVQETPTLGMRDNHSGKFLWLVAGGDDIAKALARQDWTKTQTASSGSQGGG